MGKKSKDKGGRGQRAVAKLLKGWWGSDFTSTPLSGGFATKQFRDDWNASSDVVTPDKTFPFSVEVKHQEEIISVEALINSEVSPVWKWWEQCVDESPPNKIPLLVFKRNRKPWLYMIWTIDRCGQLHSARSIQVTPPSGWRWTGASIHIPTVQIGMFEDLRKTEVEKWRNKMSTSDPIKK